VPELAGRQESPESTDPIVLTIGDIGVTRNWVVTPNGTARLSGSQWIEVSVQAGSLYHATQIPVSGQYQVAQVRQQVSQAQTLAAAAS
jgi:hypothetical protein